MHLNVTNTVADARFRSIASRLSLDPNQKWVGGYVEYEWQHSRYAFERTGTSIIGKHVLEFGCNVGATAIVLATLGAKVTAIDVNRNFIELATANAERYGVAENICFLHAEDASRLPFQDGEFDLVCCNSVLEYIPHTLLKPIQREIDRSVKRGGIIFVMGTSNRLWPREVHSGSWFTNYVPRPFDRVLFRRSLQRGVFPWQIRYGFGQYENLDLKDGGKVYSESRSRMGMSRGKQGVVRWVNAFLMLFGTTVGLFTPCIFVRLLKSR